MVKGEVLIERQVRQLQEAGITDITVVVGYKAGMFQYLKDRYGVAIVFNEDYHRYNNTSSIIRVLNKLENTYICSSDNYFPENVFLGNPRCSYYSALYANGPTNEYCLTVDEADNITNVSVGGSDSWYMVGHVYFSKDFSDRFKNILSEEYAREETRQGYWEDVYIKFLNELPLMKIHRYAENDIYEFDSLDELRKFDGSYVNNTRSGILKQIAARLNCEEASLSRFMKIPHCGGHMYFSFLKDGEKYSYDESAKLISKL